MVPLVDRILFVVEVGATMKRYLVALFLQMASQAWGATYYVDATGGLDNNTGLATDDAWKTIAKVNAFTGSNLASYGEEIDHSTWTKTGTTVSGNSVTSPDGYQTADYVLETTGNAQHIVYKYFTATAVDYTASFYLKAGGRNWAYVELTDSVLQGVYFDLANGIVGTKSADFTAGITSIGDGWYRCWVNRAASAARWRLSVYTATADAATLTFVGDASKGVYVWGAQVEIGSTPSSYKHSTFQPGDSILFKRGETFPGMFFPHAYGTAGNVITIGAYGTGNQPIIDGSAENSSLYVPPYVRFLDISDIVFSGATGSSVAILYKSNNIIFKNSIFQNGDAFSYGIQIQGSSNIFADNCVFKDNGDSGVWIGDASGVLITDNVTVSNSTIIGNGTGADGDRDGIGIYDSTNVVIRNNIINHTGGYNAAVYATADNASRQSVDIYRNSITQISGSMARPRIVTLSNGTYNFYCNIIKGYSRPNDLVRGMTVEFSNKYKVNANIYNNVITGTDTSIELGSYDVNANTTINIINNISYSPILYHIVITGMNLADINSKLVSDYNIFYPNQDNVYWIMYSGPLSTLAAWTRATGQDAHSLSSDPLFVSSSDFHLQPDSPAINAGVYVGLTTDYSGNPVPRGSAPDIGAYEASATTPSSGTGGGGCSISPEGKSKGESPLGTLLAILTPGILLVGRKARRKIQNKI